jgi:hypothetical protein
MALDIAGRFHEKASESSYLVWPFLTFLFNLWSMLTAKDVILPHSVMTAKNLIGRLRFGAPLQPTRCRQDIHFQSARRATSCGWSGV